MSSIITMTIAMLPSIFNLLMVRMNRSNKAGKQAHALPSRVLSNLPQVDKVDIRALFKKWED